MTTPETGLDPDTRKRRLSDYPVHRHVATRWADHDTYSHVNNAVHYVLIDTAVNGWLIEASGVDIRSLDAIGVVVETGCQYFQQLHFPQDVVVGIRLEGSGTSSVRYELGLFADAPDPVAVARFVHVYVARDSRTTVPIPPEIRRALAQLAVDGPR